MVTLFIRSLMNKLPPAKALQVEIAGLYWHFVDIVWIVIFTVVYLVSANDSIETSEAIISGLQGGG